MTVRTLGAILVALFAALSLVALLLSADLLLSVLERLRAIGPWAPPVFGGLALAFAAASTWLGLRLLRGPPREQRRAPPVVDPESLRDRIEHARGKGAAVGQAERELKELDRRSESGEQFIALFGGASAGKSALISALLPEQQSTSDVRGGTTTRIAHFRGERRGRIVQLADLPGLGHEATADLEPAAADEATRAHVVVYVADGDLDRDDARALERLQTFQKPLVVALNKADRYSAEELAQLTDSLGQRLDDRAIAVVAVSAGHQEQVLVQRADVEQTTTRERPADVEPLWQAIDQLLGRQSLDADRERASVQLASEKLEQAETSHRQAEGEAITEKYARRAVIGALAAITPGSDLIIQAALATRFLRELGTLYEVPVKEIEIDRFLSLAGDRLKKTTALVLAVTGNAFKAFPGIGTLTGGVIHAAAYGMIFDSLGRSVCASLEEQRALDPVFAAEQFGKSLDEAAEERVVDYAKLALRQLRRGGGSDG
ncbi:MAG: GTPase [Pseudomonadota bacterium]